jgi:parallel beta-helix repeat protein
VATTARVDRPGGAPGGRRRRLRAERAGLLRAVAVAVALALALSGVQLAAAGTATAATLPCGATVTSSVTLSADVGPCPGDGLIVNGSGITLNLGGHVVRGLGNPTVDQVGVRVVDSDNVTVSNGTVTAFAEGVALENTTASTVTGIRARGNKGTGGFNHGDGIIVDGSSDNHVTGNDVSDNGPFSGITLVDDADGNIVSGNNIHDNTLVRAQPSQVAPRQENYGVRFDTGANNNLIEGNRIVGNGSDGVNAPGFDHAGNVVRNNLVQGNGGYGIAEPGVDFVISGNQVVANGFDQFEVPGRTRESFDGIIVFGNLGGGAGVIENNLAQGNAHDGLAVRTNGFTFFGEFHPPAVDEIRGNTATGNGRNGIFVECDFVANLFPQHVCVPNDPPHEGHHLTANQAFQNGGAGTGRTAWDLYDENPNCDHNRWIDNKGGVVNPPCTLTTSP